MKTKKILAMLLTMILLLGILPAAARAEGGAISLSTAEAAAETAGSGEISLSSAKAAPGETVSVTVTIDANPGVMFLKLEPEYDESVLTLNSMTAGEAGSSAWEIAK